MRLPDLDLDLLRCFVEVAERGGFTAAGIAPGLTQSAVSLKIKRLEELVGRSLLARFAARHPELRLEVGRSGELRAALSRHRQGDRRIGG